MEGRLDHRGALFGEFPIGEAAQGNLYYTRRRLCGDEVPGTPDAIQREGYFLMVDRGGCSFVEKVRNAQKNNATAVLIADNTCLCSFPADVCDEDLQCEDSEPTMDDDGTGSDIRIPSMLLLKPDADMLKQELIAGRTIQLEVSWPIPMATNGKTEYSLWMTPDDIMSHHFLMTFVEAAAALGEKATFRPKMYIHDGVTRGCQGNDGGADPCPGFCTNGGRYCEPRSYYDFDAYDNKGTRMIVESLRRACIWDVYGEEDGIGAEWWTYMQLWIQRCGGSHFSSSCSDGLFEVSGIDKDKVELCMTNSGDFRSDVPNVFLQEYIEEADAFDVTFSPTLFVNGAVVRGDLSFGSVLEAICMTYEDSDIPEACFRWEACAKQCGKDKKCVLHGTECIEYDVPAFEYDSVWDDDYLVTPYVVETVEWETEPSVGTSTEESDNVDDTEGTPETIESSLDTVSPANPTEPQLSQDPVPAPTNAPVAPTEAPVPPPTDAPIGPDLGNPFVPPQSSGGGVSETIQIFEGGGGPNGGVLTQGNAPGNPSVVNERNAGFAAGLGVGITAAVLLVAFVIFLVRDNRRNGRRRPPLRKIRQEYSLAPSELTGSHVYYEDDDEFDYDDGYDYDDYEEEGFEDERLWVAPTGKRRFIGGPRRSQRGPFGRSRRVIQRPSMSRSVREVRTKKGSRSRRSRFIDDDEEGLSPTEENVARHARSYRDIENDDEEVSEEENQDMRRTRKKRGNQSDDQDEDQDEESY